jgi:DNA-binding GntR family transcriptional regulator
VSSRASKASDRAYQFIREEILSGALPAGEQVREEQLAAACGVSRTPIREAMRRLEAERFLRRTDSQRTYVNQWTLDEIEEGFALRGMLEGRAAYRAATRISESDLARLQAHNRSIDRIIQAGGSDIQSFLDHNRAFHAIVLEAAGSANLAQLLAGIVEQPIVARTARHYDLQQISRSVAEHDELVLAFRHRDPDWAQAVMTAHIRRAFHAYVEAHRGSPEQSDETSHQAA